MWLKASSSQVLVKDLNLTCGRKPVPAVGTGGAGGPWGPFLAPGPAFAQDPPLGLIPLSMSVAEAGTVSQPMAGLFFP